MTKDPFADFHVNDKPNSDAFGKLHELLQQLQEAENAVDEAELTLKLAKQRKQHLEQEAIPEQMDNMGMEEFTTKDGLFVKVVNKIKASIGNRKKPAFEWLISNGHGGIIKRNIIVPFGIDQADEAMQLQTELLENFPDAKQDMKVEAASLTRFVKEMLEAGVDIPQDVFGVHSFKIAQTKQK